MPICTRPSLIMSSVARSWARRSGWYQGTIEQTTPTLTRVVWAANRDQQWHLALRWLTQTIVPCRHGCCRPISAPVWLAEEHAARHGGQPVDASTRGEEEDAPILAPGQVRGQLR